MNLALLEKVKQQLLLYPNNFNMRVGLINTMACGTTGCIAGWAVFLSNPKYAKHRLDSQDGIPWASHIDSFSISQVAIEELDLPVPETGETIALFHLDYWPPEFKKEYESAATELGRAKVACKVIDYYVEFPEELIVRKQWDEIVVEDEDPVECGFLI